MNSSSVDFSHFLPQELWLQIFSLLPPSALGTLCSVSKLFKTLAMDPLLWQQVTKNYHPNTYSRLSERRIVQKSVEGLKRRKLLASPTEIDWRQKCIERTLFVCGVKKTEELQCASLHEAVNSFDVVDDRVFAGEGNHIVTFLIDQTGEKIICKTEHQISYVKAKKREDGNIDVYTGNPGGNLKIWLFDGTCFEEKQELEHYSEVFAVETYRDFLVSADYYSIFISNKDNGELLLKFDYDSSHNGLSCMTLEQNKIYVGTTGGIVIWDLDNLELIGEINIVEEFGLNHSIRQIKIYDEKIFYSSKKKIFMFDPEQDSLTKIMAPAKEIFFDIYENDLFYSRFLEQIERHNIVICDLKTSDIVSTFVTSDGSPITSPIKVGPYGLLHNSAKLFITKMPEDL